MTVKPATAGRDKDATNTCELGPTKKLKEDNVGATEMVAPVMEVETVLGAIGAYHSASLPPTSK